MSEENLQRRFRSIPVTGKLLHSESSSKDLKIENDGGLYNLTELDRDTNRHIDEMRNGGSNILVQKSVSSRQHD